MRIFKDDLAYVLLEEDVIRAKVKELGEKISRDYEGGDLVAICILKGSIVFFSDLIREMDIHLNLDFMAISSYGNSRQSSGIVKIVKDLEINIAGKDVLIVEDIMDSGRTLAFLSEMLNARDPKSLKICCLLDKPSRRVASIEPNYCGFEIPDEFVVGYGLDFSENYRNLPYIAVLSPDVYS